jgi:hypothetical protein
MMQGCAARYRVAFLRYDPLHFDTLGQDICGQADGA